MKKIISIIFMILLLVGCSDVPPGYKGIKVYLLGGPKGVDSEVLGVGRYWIGINEQLFTFPTFTVTHAWTKFSSEGSPQDESITFQDKDGLTVNTDLGISFHIEDNMVPVVFQKYRKGIEEITHIFLRNAVRDALVTEAANMSIDEIYGPKKAELMRNIVDMVRKEVGSTGINVEKIYWVNEMRLPPQIIDNINAKIGAIQKTAQRENEVAQSKAEAQKRVVEAQGEADAILAKAEAEAKAYELKINALSKNPQGLIMLEYVEKWNGVLPTWMTDTKNFTPMITVPQQ